MKIIKPNTKILLCHCAVGDVVAILGCEENYYLINSHEHDGFVRATHLKEHPASCIFAGTREITERYSIEEIKLKRI